MTTDVESNYPRVSLKGMDSGGTRERGELLFRVLVYRRRVSCLPENLIETSATPRREAGRPQNGALTLFSFRNVRLVNLQLFHMQLFQLASFFHMPVF